MSRHRLTFIAALAGCLAASTDGRSQELVMSPQLANHLSHIEVGVRAGRIAAAPRFLNRNMTSSTQSTERQEELRIDTAGAGVSIDYKLSTKSFVVTLQLERGRELRIRRNPHGGATGPVVEFRQPAEGALTASIGDAARPKTYEFESLWHLMIAEPDLAKNEIEPLLRLIHPGWALTATARGIEEQLLKHAAGMHDFDRRRWAELVAQLGSDKFVDRESADRMLRELGRTTVPYLRNLDEDRLDAEQRRRVRAILQRYAGDDAEDSPASAADWLSGDPDVWYALAARSAPTDRATIRAQLSSLLGEPVVLDDGADEAALQAQLAKIREQIDRRRGM